MSECEQGAQASGGPTQATDGRPMVDALRHDWTADEILTILESPFIDLVYRAQGVHRGYHADNTVQLASLLSIKTGACPEDCKYCPQSAHYAKNTGLERETMLDVDVVLDAAAQA